jgi:hypothetical protein
MSGQRTSKIKRRKNHPIQPPSRLDTPVIPMFGAPERNLGEADPCFTPFQYFALTAVEGGLGSRDPAFWLTEEEIDTVDSRGIELLGQYYWHEKLDTYVTGNTAKHKRPRLVVRYNRALLARHVLDSIIVGVRDTARVFRQICVAERRERALAGMDPNLVLLARKKHEEILLKKAKQAKSAFIGLKSGEEAVAQLEEQVAAWETWPRQRKRKAIVAAPIEFRSARDAEEQAKHETITEAVEAAASSTDDPSIAQIDSRPGTRGSRVGKRADMGKKTKSSDPLPAESTPSQPLDRSDRPGPSVADLFAADSGFATPDEDQNS